MGLQYASYVVPQAPQSSLADLLPQFLSGQQRRRDDDATAAAATLGQPNGQPQPDTLASLQPQQPSVPGPAQAQPRLPMPNTGNPATVGDRASQLASYESSVGRSESNNNPNAVNPTTGATGLYQALPSTWADVSQRHPDLGLTPDGINDPAQQQKFMQAFTLDNAKTLSTNGIAPNPSTLYAAHFLGAGGAVKALSAPDETPMSAVAPDAMASNPNIADMNVGQFKQWAQQQGTRGQGGYSPPSAANLGPGAGPPNLASVPNPPQVALPPQASMLALLRSPDTRPLAMQMIQASRAGQDPSTILGNTLTREQIANYGVPAGYVRNAQGGMQAIPGGPEDPANPLNAMKTGGFAQTMAGNSQVSVNENGQPNADQQQQFLTTLPPSTAGLVKGVADYQLDPTKVSSMRGNQRQQLIQLAQQYDPTFDMSQYPARSAMRKSVTSGPVSQNILAANTAIQHLSELNDIVDKLPNTPFSALNAVTNAGQSQFGSQDHKQALATFQQTATAATDELAKLFKGAGASDIKTIEDWGKGLDVNADPQVLHATIHNAIANLLKARLDTIDSQYQQVMGKPADFQILKPAAIQALQKLGIDPTSLDPSAAAAINQQQGQPQSGAPAQGATPQTAPTKISGDDDYNALPSGATFIAPDGTTRKKP